MLLLAIIGTEVNPLARPTNESQTERILLAVILVALAIVLIVANHARAHK